VKARKEPYKSIQTNKQTNKQTKFSVIIAQENALLEDGNKLLIFINCGVYID